MLNFEEDMAPLSHFTGPGPPECSAVFNSEEDLAPLSHFTDQGTPECERCVQTGKHGDGKRMDCLNDLALHALLFTF